MLDPSSSFSTASLGASMRTLATMRILLFCLLQLIAIQPAVSASSVVEIVGGIPITVPAPPGFSDPSSISKDLRVARQSQR